jgi:FkbM family methyltransferase
MGGGGYGEKHILERLISSLRLGDIVYDIGSHVGLYTIFLAKAVGSQGRVIAFEPETQNYKHLLKNLKQLNSLTNIRVFQKALGGQNGKRKLYLGEDTANASLVRPYSGKETYELVEIVNGDRFVEIKDLPIPRLVKIDVEGYEYNVIEGLRHTLADTACEFACCEIHPQLLPTEIKEEQILELLKSLGFNHIEVYRRGTEYHVLAQKEPFQKNKKMKVLVCAYACLKDPDKRFGDGGEAVLGWNIVKQLARFHRVFVLSHSQNRSDIEKALEKEPISNIKFYYLDLLFFNFLQKFSGGVQIYAYLWQIKAYFFAKKLDQKFHFDVFHHLTYANDWMASFIGALLPIPYIRGPGGGAHRVPKNFLSEFSFFGRLAQYLRSLGQWLFRHDPFFILGQKRAKAILVCNRESFEAIPKKWQNKTYLFPVNGISKEDLDLLKSKEAEISGNKYSHGRVRIAERSEVALFACNRFKVLSAGKLLPIKGFSLAITAFKIFSDKFPETEFGIIGDGPEFHHLKNLVRELKIEDKVKFKKWMARNEFLKELKSCDVFLFPSLRDGGGAVVVEAMAAGKPVICLDIAGPGFHIENEWGIKIKPHSPEQAVQEMAEALEKLYLNKGLRFQLGRKARERAEKEYFWNNLGEKLFEIYQKVLKV